MASHNAQRDFATQVVRTLRDAGHQALWAGGCVRDALLGITPKDYDVATDAPPDRVREVFGKRRTLPIGAAFGVITVLGPKDAGQIEVATFRTEAGYADGRRPDHVEFTTAEFDASRRDFTVNGLFFDPIAEQVIDYVGGRVDLDAKLIRAIGDAEERFAEDKLRMLRAVRFASSLGFSIEAATAEAIRRHAAEIVAVSPERIGAELRRMLTGAGRSHAVALLDELGLLGSVIPELVGIDDEACRRLCRILTKLQEATLPAALACLLDRFTDGGGVSRRAMALKFTRKEADRAGWLAGHYAELADAQDRPWSQVQPLLAHDGGVELVDVYEAIGGAQDAAGDFCRTKLALPSEQFDPPPLLTGDDLVKNGFRPGPRFASLLAWVRAAQLDGEVHTFDQALALVRREASDTD